MSHEDFIKEQKELGAKFEQDITAPETAVAEAEKEAEKEAENKEKSVIQSIIEEGGVTQEQIDGWKDKFNGKVFAVWFDKNDNYIFRYCTRIEYREILSQYNSSAKGAQTNDLFDELLIQKTLLYPKFTPDLKAVVAAGTFPTLSKQIQLASNFIPDEMAFTMITKA